MNLPKNGKYVDNVIGHIFYYKDGRLHREDGPAVESLHGSKLFYLDGIVYSKDEYIKEIKRRGLATPNYFKNFL